MRRKKGQIWSVDTLIAFIIFLSAVAFFMIYFSGTQDSSVQTKQDAEFIPQVLSADAGGIPLIKSNTIDKDTLRTLVTMNYTQLKALLGVQSDFCIYFVDKNGNLINLTEELGPAAVGTTNTIYGIGNGQINISPGVPCKN